MKLTKRTLTSIILLIISSAAFATDYTFTGTGAWSNTANWDGGLKPPSVLNAGNTITILGTTSVINNCPSACPDLSLNNGTITIAAGGSLSLQNATQFSNGGTIIVNGTLTCQTTFENYNGASITVNGTLLIKTPIVGGPFASFTSQGLITVNSGGLINNQFKFDNTFVNPTGIIIVNGGTIINNGILFKPGNLTNNGGIVSNTTSISGNSTIIGNLTNSGTIAPGNSPGLITVDGDYTATSTAVHNFEIAGTAAANYDRLLTTGSVNLNGTLNATLIGGFTPTSSNDLTIITGTINGTFSNVNIPAAYSIIYNTNSVVLRFLSPLPVNFLSLDARKENNGVNLIWKVSGEESVLKYEVEKSEDGRQFTKLGEFQANNQNSYSFTDRQSKNKSYYRIKGIDLDGKYKYSTVITFNNGKSSVQLLLFPNPVKESATLQHDVAKKGSLISVVSATGQVVREILPQTDSQQTTIDLSGLGQGMYMIQYRNAAGNIQLIKCNKQ